MSKLANPSTAEELRSLPDKSCVAVGVVSGLYARKRDERIFFFCATALMESGVTSALEVILSCRFPKPASRLLKFGP